MDSTARNASDHLRMRLTEPDLKDGKKSEDNAADDEDS
jgi:hypothetical protein